MAKPTTELKLKKEYKDRGYKADNKLYICPVCDANLRKLKGDNVRQKMHGLWKNVVVCVLVFRKKGYPSIAACPKCGLRRSDKHTQRPQVEDNGHCAGKTKKDKPCRNKAQSNGYCATHQDQAVQPPTNL